MKTIPSMLVALSLLTGSALAQTAPATGAKTDPTAQKFATLDVDKSGFLDGKELDAFKPKLSLLDMNKDGKVSPDEFNIGVMTGVVVN